MCVCVFTMVVFSLFLIVTMMRMMMKFALRGPFVAIALEKAA